MAAVLVDDALLYLVARGREPAYLRSSGSAIWTTGLWYHRLCRAVAHKSVAGALSRMLANDIRSDVGNPGVEAIGSLTQEVGLLSLRELSWSMARLLNDGIRLNVMSLEALAAAERLDAEICLVEFDRNLPLLSAAQARGVPVRFVTVPS